MISYVKNPENMREDSIQVLYAAFPFLLHPDLRFMKFDASPPGSSLKIDLLFLDAKAQNIWAEVEYRLVDVAQISEYARTLARGLSAGTDRLCWVVPQSKAGTVAMPGTSLCIHRYDEKSVEEWVQWRSECAADLDAVAALLSQSFQYELGRTLDPGNSLRFANVIDALSFYGYVNVENKKGKPARRKVGFHLGTMGWNLDLIRNLSTPGSPFREFYPELSIKLILELLEAPFRYEDPKIRRGGNVEQGGLLTLIREYRKGGSNWNQVCDILEKIHEIVSAHRVKLLEMDDRVHAELTNASIAHFDLLEVLWPRIGMDIGRDGQVHALSLLKGLWESFRLEQLPRTTRSTLSDGNLIENTRTEPDVPNMARRLIELMTLKGLLLPKLSMYPAMNTLRWGADMDGHVRLEILPVADFTKTTDLALHRETLRREAPKRPVTFDDAI